MLSKLDNGKLAFALRKCGKCNNYIELMEHGVTGVASNHGELLYSIINDDEIKLNLEQFCCMCPVHRKAVEGSTCYTFSPEELQLMSETKLKDIWMTLE